MIARFVHEHKGSWTAGLRWGVDPICRVLSEHGLPISPSTYYEQMTRRPSRREISDEDLKPQVRRVWEANFRVYGARKVWLALNREGVTVARCALMITVSEWCVQYCHVDVNSPRLFSSVP